MVATFAETRQNMCEHWSESQATHDGIVEGEEQDG